MDLINDSELIRAAGITYLTPETCLIKKKGDFLSVSVKNNSEESDESFVSYDRVNLHRMFPYDSEYKYISVLDLDSAEIGIIKDVSVFDADARELIENELHRKYYVCRLHRIESILDRYGYSYWKAESSDGEVSFTLRDTYSSILKSSDGEIFIIDIDGNRYDLPPFDSLDKKSKKLIDIYL